MRISDWSSDVCSSDLEDLGEENVAAVRKGCDNLGRHLRNVAHFGVPAVVAINRFARDTEAEVEAVSEFCVQFGVEAHVCSHWADGGAGTESLAHKVAMLADHGDAQFRPLYRDEKPLWEKVRTIARTLYGADDVIADKAIRDRFAQYQADGYGHFPVCMAKTQYSFSTDPRLKGAPTDHVVPIREVRLAGGAEFLVVICGEVMTMPGLPRTPAANAMTVDAEGRIDGLF